MLDEAHFERLLHEPSPAEERSPKRMRAAEAQPAIDETYFHRLLHEAPSTENAELLHYGNVGFLENKPDEERDTALPLEQAIVPAPKRRRDYSYVVNREKREEIFDVVRQLWEIHVINGMMHTTKKEHDAALARRPPLHICGVSANCVSTPVHVRVFVPRSQWASKHICIYNLCPLRYREDLHAEENCVWEYSNFYGCVNSGILHHCEKSMAHEPYVGTTTDRLGRVVCLVSGNDLLGEKHVQDHVVQNTGISYYTVQHEGRREERQVLERLNVLRRYLGTSHKLDAPLLNKDQFVSDEEYSLAVFRKELYTALFGKERVEKEVLSNTQIVSALALEASAMQHEDPDGVLYLTQLEMLAHKYQRHCSKYPSLVASFDNVDRIRFVNFYALFCFFIWQYIRRNYNQVMLMQNDQASRQNTKGGVTREMEDAMRNTDDCIQKKQRGDVILENCAMATLRILEAGITDEMFAVFGGHVQLCAIMPQLNGIINYNFVTHANTQTRNTIHQLFVSLVTQNNQPLHELVSIPTITWDDVRELPQVAKQIQGQTTAEWDEVADTKQLREAVERSLIVVNTNGDVQ